MANDINYDPNDSRLTGIDDDYKADDKQLTDTYDDMMTNTDKYYEDQKAAWENYGKEQKDIAERQHQLTVSQINQDIADAKKDYIKEQSGAYVDLQRNTNQYGVNAEQMASSGLTNTGFSESSKVSMLNTHQNRIAVARESFIRAETNFKNQITQAQIANDTLLAEIALDTLKKISGLAIEQAQYKNQLLMDLTEKKAALKQNYYQRYLSMADQINKENAIAEEIRLYEESINNANNSDENPNGNTQSSQWTESVIDMLNQGLSTGHHPITGKPLSGFSAMHDPIPVNDNAKQRDTIPILDRIASNFGANDPVGNQPSPNSVVSSKKEAVSTEYYKGPMNKDVEKYGAFSNGYQPKGISGHGKLTKSGQTYTFNTKTLSGEYKYVTQSVWKAEDGSLWYWEGRQNKYLPYHSGYRRST